MVWRGKWGGIVVVTDARVVRGARFREVTVMNRWRYVSVMSVVVTISTSVRARCEGRMVGWFVKVELGGGRRWSGG